MQFICGQLVPPLTKTKTKKTKKMNHLNKRKKKTTKEPLNLSMNTVSLSENKIEYNAVKLVEIIDCIEMICYPCISILNRIFQQSPQNCSKKTTICTILEFDISFSRVRLVHFTKYNVSWTNFWSLNVNILIRFNGKCVLVGMTFGNYVSLTMQERIL